MLIPLPIIHLFVINWSSRYQNHYEYIALDPFLGVFFFHKKSNTIARRIFTTCFDEKPGCVKLIHKSLFKCPHFTLENLYVQSTLELFKSFSHRDKFLFQVPPSPHLNSLRFFYLKKNLCIFHSICVRLYSAFH